MLSSYHSLDPIMQRLLEEEWQRMPRARKSSTKTPKKHKALSKASLRPPHELSPVVAVLPCLIRMVRENPDQTVEQIRPTIKRMILEQLFVDVSGDSVIEEHHNVKIKQYVELTARVLVRARRHEAGEALWSDAPVTPQMFG